MIDQALEWWEKLSDNVIRLCACCVKTNQNINLNTKKHRL